MERLSVNVTQRTADSLRRLAAARGTTITETVRRAVAVLALVEDTIDAGAQVQVVDPGHDATFVLRLL